MTQTLKMRISFTGIESNALRSLWELEELAKSHEDYEEFDNAAYSVQACISAYRDTILAICKGDVDTQTVKDFWFHNEEIGAVSYRGDVINFRDESETI